jgi:biotin transport system substrate-specific component
MFCIILIKPVITLTELLWALVGLLLTIMGSFLGAQITNTPWQWTSNGVQAYPLGITYQIGAVLLVGCLGGANAGAIAQIAYLVLGLFGFLVFDQGGGLGYLQQPTFGYLLGFVPAAWVCGQFAFKTRNRPESIAFSCFVGLLIIHLTGIAYLTLGHFLKLSSTLANLSWLAAVSQYSIYPFPGQLAVICAVTVMAYLLRVFMFW